MGEPTMKQITIAVAVLASIVMVVGAGADPAPESPRPQPTPTPTPVPEPGRIIERVSGDPALIPEARGEGWRFEDMVITTALPEGYPAPTPPGVVEIKQYPSVRRAEVSGTTSDAQGQTQGFWPLFLHIQRRGIPMTAPVEMELEGWDATEGKPPTRWTMAFLYRTQNEGPTGRDGNVVIRDSEPLTVLAIGARGRYGADRYAPLLETLENWLAENANWEAAGEPRWLGYNGPEVPRARQWGEVQLPIRKVDTSEQGKSREE
ncbi:MAG: hypothetical protein EA380_10950 [Phycisphaeraceae bacterium]|nr:MAG: hypothetical protein EA380_10950 [Phycisphaeraceae bacterium]